jgi:hypothetical protein
LMTLLKVREMSRTVMDENFLKENSVLYRND